MNFMINAAVICIICLVVMVTHCLPMKVVHPGRHVCLDTRQVHTPVTQIQSYCQPAYQKKLRMCGVEGAQRLCTSFRVVYKTAYRRVFKSAVTSHHVYMCCPGWTQQDPRDRGCMKPKCTLECQNGGECRDQKCQCKTGWTGINCETDIDECTQNSVCEHKCTNNLGSFQCDCQEGFELDTDQKSCKYCLKCQPEYKHLVNDYNQVNNRLKDMEAKIQVHPASNALLQNTGTVTVEKHMQQDKDNQIFNSVKTELMEHIRQSHASLKATLLDDIFSFMKQTVQPEIQDVIGKHLQSKLSADITSDMKNYVDAQVISNVTICRDTLQKNFKGVQIELDSYKGTLKTYSKDMSAYRQEVEHYKNELKGEMSKLRVEVEHLRKEVFEQSVEPTATVDYSMLVSLSEQIGMLEAQITRCNCGS